jgi:RNA polymerase sigma-70 factor (ECF subfamily)
MLRHFGIDRKAVTSTRRSAEDADVALIGRVAAGDLHAFETLFRIYHPRLDRFLSLMTARRTLVEEVLNDTMLVVWRRSQTYNGQSKVSTWIFAIAYRKALKARMRWPDPVEDLQQDNLVSNDPAPDAELQRGRVHDALLIAMDTLSTEQRAVVDLTYFHELGYREIAEILSCPVDTVKTRMFHARRRLKKALPGTFADWL